MDKTQGSGAPPPVGGPRRRAEKVQAGPRVVYESAPLTRDDITDSTVALAGTYQRRASISDSGVCVVDGYGVRLSVSRGALVVEDGAGPYRRDRRFERATHGLSRVVLIGATGAVTLDVLDWCRRLNVSLLVLGADGVPVFASVPNSNDDARLRRVQAAAADDAVGIHIARSLLARKLTGQAALLANRFADMGTAETIGRLSEAMPDVRSIDEARQLEASAAALYWQSWSNRVECVPRFAARDRSRIPPHWSRYEGRRSVLASGNANRKAERPVNALLNYLYALLEAETIFACQIVGLDPGLGIVHNDTKGRQSLALDIMEPIRPTVDGYVLDMVSRRTFRKADFVETSDGHCRIRSPLTHELAETLLRWAKEIAPIAEGISHLFGDVMAGKFSPVTPLTGNRARTAQAVVKARKAAAHDVATSSVARQRPIPGSQAVSLWSCPDCGGPVSNHRHVRCDACIEADPRQAPEVRGRRGAAIAARKRALRAWDEVHPDAQYDPQLFRREILPRLQGVKLADIMAASGMSKGFASDIRRGRYMPHVSTWRALAELVGIPVPGSRQGPL